MCEEHWSIHCHCVKIAWKKYQVRDSCEFLFWNCFLLDKWLANIFSGKQKLCETQLNDNKIQNKTLSFVTMSACIVSSVPPYTILHYIMRPIRLLFDIIYIVENSNRDDKSTSCNEWRRLLSALEVCFPWEQYLQGSKSRGTDFRILFTIRDAHGLSPRSSAAALIRM